MNAQEIALALGSAVRNGCGYLCRCPVPSHGRGRGDRNPSLSIRDGDSGKPLVHCFAGCGARDVLAEIRRLGIIDDRSDRDRADSAPPPRKPAAPDLDLAGRIDRARRIWHASGPVAGTRAEDYLLARGLAGPFPPTLRFNPGVPYFEGASAPIVLPVLVAAVAVWPGNRVEGVAVVHLDPRGAGKARVVNAKKTFGRVGGGAVRLAPAGPVLAIAEGVETDLAVQGSTGIPTWAALSAANIGNVNLPAFVREVTVAADGDDAGRKAARKAATRWTRAGVRVHLADPGDGADYNDILVRGAA